MVTTTMRKLRANMKSYFDDLSSDKNILVVHRQGDKEAIINLTLSEYNSIVETDYILYTENNRKVIHQAKAELEGGEIIAFDTSSI